MLHFAGLWDTHKTLKYTVHAERRIFFFNVKPGGVSNNHWALQG
jgi:hypothetical protein